MAKLIIYKNQKELISLELDPAKEYIAGRSPDCDIMLDDVVFSRQHFKLFYAQGKWTVQSISKYSQLEINHRESDYFNLRSEDKFGTFTYEFLFRDYSEPKETPISYSKDIDGKTSEVIQDDKTFVPEMTSQEWSIGVPYMLLRKDAGSTQTMRLEGDYWIMGRDESCDITIDDPKASREHCEIYHKQKKYFIIDKGSSNGTLLNYKKIASSKETPLKSGDQIQIGKYLFIFEIRDPLFAEKLTNLPMDVGYSNTHSVNYVGEDDSSKRVIKTTPADPKKKYMMIGGAVVLLLAVYFLSSGDEKSQQDLSSQGTKQSQAMTELSPEQKDLVDKSYNLAKTLYTQGKYELALTELEKIHALVPEYKDSKEIAQYSKNAIDTLAEQKDIARGELEQKKLIIKVEGIVDQCEAQYSSRRSSEALQNCLSPALELDPENANAAQLLEIAEQDDLRKEQVVEQRAAYNSRVSQRKGLFYQAERLKKQGRSLDALTAYSRHIASELPDPDRLEEKSKQEVRSLQQKIGEDIRRLKGQASAAYSKKDYKGAISKLEQALRLDPQNGEIKDQYSNYSKELQGLVKNFYGDSVLEENLGNLEVAKEKWKKIRDMDVPYGEYYKKSGLKLKKYGL